MSQERHGQIRERLTPQQRQDLEYAYGRALAYAVKIWGLKAADAEDLVGVALVRAIERMDKYVPRTGVPFLSWFKRVLLNVLRDEKRHRACTERLRDSAADCSSPRPQVPPDVQMANAQAQICRDRLLTELSLENRFVFGVWAMQRARLIGRDDAAARLGYSISEYEAAKKRIEREVLRTMERLALRPEDLFSVMPTAMGVSATRHQSEEDGT